MGLGLVPLGTSQRRQPTTGDMAQASSARSTNNPSRSSSVRLRQEVVTQDQFADLIYGALKESAWSETGEKDWKKRLNDEASGVAQSNLNRLALNRLRLGSGNTYDNYAASTTSVYAAPGQFPWAGTGVLSRIKTLGDVVNELHKEKVLPKQEIREIVVKLAKRLQNPEEMKKINERMAGRTRFNSGIRLQPGDVTFGRQRNVFFYDPDNKKIRDNWRRIQETAGNGVILREDFLARQREEQTYPSVTNSSPSEP
jgi:hypothetical protein